tara:strand:+ start:59 stop:1330 length:1272 start_codon:yes stop_codon:yes gene_type:complete
MKKKSKHIAVIGLGYVGLPLAVEFGKYYQTLGFDIDEKRIEEIKTGLDRTKELSFKELKKPNKISFTCDANELKNANIYIVTVPTPINKNKSPDLRPLKKASKLVGKHIKLGDIVIYESTVYPGATEEICVPILEKNSNLKFNSDFFVGYSPERINPGDKKHKLRDIIKVTSGSNKKTAQEINNLYSKIIKAGTFLASSIKVAEAAKVIENTQRDLNIGLINELSIIFNILGIDTNEVLKAAATKWNFLKFKPGLVGGHCIGVDPYYLTYKAQSEGYNPEVILAGRRLNDSMPKYIASQLVKQMLIKKIPINQSKILVIGFTFKENCNDIRNTKVVDLIKELNDYDINVDCFDPLADHDEVKQKYGIKLLDKLNKDSYDGIILAVSHRSFTFPKFRPSDYGKKNHVIYDLKNIIPANNSDLRL